MNKKIIQHGFIVTSILAVVVSSWLGFLFINYAQKDSALQEILQHNDVFYIKTGKLMT
jgi:hypothetical protein